MFTRDQIEEIKKKLIMLGTKDTQFPDAHKLNGEEIIAIVQDGENKKIPLSSIINDDFINVSKDTTEILTLSTAVSKIDINNRKLGQVITFKDSANSWAIRQFTGSSLDNWNDISLWKSISGIDELKSQVETNTSNISSINTEVSAMQSKVDENTTSISQINTTLEEHTESINAKITTDRIEDEAVTIGKLEPSIQSLITNISKNASFAGIATPTTNPGTPDGPVFYLATQAGTYSNFSGIKLTEGEVAILQWNNGTWTKKTTELAVQKAVNDVQEQVNDVQEQVFGTPIISTWEEETLMKKSLTTQSSKGYKLSSVIPVKAGDKFTINSAGNYVSFITYCQQDGTPIKSLLSSSNASTTDNVLRSLTIESDGYVRICYKYSIAGAFAAKGDNVLNDIENLQEKHIRFFVFGNSYGCDSVSYVPFILKEMGITSDIYMHVRDACSLRDIYNRWESDAPRDNETDGIHAGTYQRFITHIDTRTMTRWQTITRESMKIALERGGWDFITLQQFSAYSIDPKTYAPWLDLDISLINKSLDKETTLAWTQVWTRSTHDNQSASLSTFRDTVYAKYPFEMFIPCGTAIFNARANPSIAQIGEGTNLWASDGIHLQDGLGCYIAALTIVESILRKFFPNKSIMFDRTEIGDNILSWGIPEFHGPVVGMTKENRLAAQKAVIMACNHMFEINAAKYDPFIEYETLSDFPETGTSGILYKATDTGYTYTWEGNQYVYNEALPYNI